MIDRKKVIEGLELCTAEIPPDGSMHQYDFCIKCPYHDPVFIYCFNKNALMKDALEVIKEQEPVAPTHSYSVYRCGKCGYIVGIDDIKGVPGYKSHYCADCGKGVKWHD